MSEMQSEKPQSQTANTPQCLGSKCPYYAEHQRIKLICCDWRVLGEIEPERRVYGALPPNKKPEP